MVALSVVIPTFNTAQMTLRCCRAVLASMPEGTEVIVADDGSSDGTAELLAAEPALRIVRLESNRGFAPAANRGVSAATGRIIVLLNSDAIVEGDALSTLLSAFDSDALLGIAGAQLMNADGTAQWSGGVTPTLPWMIGVVSGAGHLARHFRSRRTLRAEVDWVSGAAMAFRREVWDAAGPLDERYRFYCQDIDFCLRARAAGWRVRVIGSARVVHAIGGTIGETIGETLHHDQVRLPQSTDKSVCATQAERCGTDTLVCALWPDLLDWGAAHYGRRWTFIARAVLVSVAWVRIAWRASLRKDVAPFLRAARSLRASGKNL